MPYPDNRLSDDEEVVRHLHPHWLTLIAPTIVFVVTVALAAFAATVVPSGSSEKPLQIAILAVAVVILARFVLVPFLRWKTTHYVITTHRVLIRRGILTHKGTDIPLKRLNDVAFEQSLLDRMLGAGTLMLESAGEHGQEVLVNIPHADHVQQLLNRLVEEDSDRRDYRMAPPPPDAPEYQ